MSSKKLNILTYGTFDAFHFGHLLLLRRAKELSQGGKLVVGVSSDAFNKQKGKKFIFSYQERAEMIKAIRFVDSVFEESSWDQKVSDIQKYNIDILVMGSDWQGEFDHLDKHCRVMYLERTPAISSTGIRTLLDP